jgi:putative transposase
MRRCIRNLVDKLHKKVPKWTCKNYNTIFLPKFETQKMVSKRQRKINSKTARNMLTWSHYRFKTRLMNKARVPKLPSYYLR